MFLRQFRADITTGRLEVFSVGDPEFAMAELLVERTRSTCACAPWMPFNLPLHWNCEIRSSAEHFVAADMILCEVAGREGFSVINPERS